ncbi:MAG: hypothetical protein AAB074_20205 [Planctomycetota bacterium]
MERSFHRTAGRRAQAAGFAIVALLAVGCGKKSPDGLGNGPTRVSSSSTGPASSSGQTEPDPGRRKTAFTAAPEIMSESEEGFVDLVFFIADHRRESDGTCVFRAKGLHDGREMEFEILYGSTARRVVEIRRSGASSDEFVKVLDKLFGTGLSPEAMSTSCQFSRVVLSGDPAHPESATMSTKLFHTSGDESLYFELYLNFDLPTRRLELKEKDSEYREAVMKVLSGKR